MRSVRARIVTVVALALAAAVPAALHARSAGDGPASSPAWVPVGAHYADGVDAIAGAGSKVYVGGGFSCLAPPFGGFAVFRAGESKPETRMVRFRDGGQVTAITGDGRGGWFVGGSFTSFGGDPCPRLVHVLANGRVDPMWCPRPSDEPTLLACEGSVLYAGILLYDAGYSTTLARYDIASGRRLPWRVVLGRSETIYPPNVWALTATPERVYLGGGFASVGGHPAKRLAAIDAETGRFVWGARVEDGPVSAIVVRRGRVFAFGRFDGVDRHPRRGVAALDARTGVLLDWHPSLPLSHVFAVVASKSVLYVGFREVLALHRLRSESTLAAIDANSGATLWRRRDDAYPVALVGGNLLIHLHHALVAVDPATGRPKSWHFAIPSDPGVVPPGGPVAVSGSRVAFGGDFYAVDPGVARRGLAAIDVATGVRTAWRPKLALGDYDAVHSLVVAGNTLYVAGGFTAINGRKRHGLAAFDLDTGRLSQWSPHSSCDELRECGDVVAANANAVFVAGATIAGGVRAITAFDPTTGARLPWSAGVGEPSVAVAALSGLHLYVGGGFVQVQGIARPYLAAVDAGTGALESWQPQPDSHVTALAVAGTTLYVGGQFTHMGTTARAHLAAFDTVTGELLPWDPGPAYDKLNPGSGVQVRHIVVAGTTVYVDGIPFDATTAAPIPWPNGPGVVDALAVGGPFVYATGSGGLVAVPPPR